MALFPQINTDFLPYQTDDHLHIKELMERYYAQSITINQSFWSEADIDSRFRAGDQTLWNDIYGNLPAFRRRVFNFNRIRPICNMISGYQRNHRKSIKITPIENSDEQTATQFTKTIMWAIEKDGTLETISKSFDQTLTTGMSLLAIWMDYREDPINGNIRVDNVPYNAYLIDPFFTKHDLSDCNFIWTRKWFTKAQLKSLLPEQKDQIDKLYARGNRDGKFQFMPQSYNYGMENLLTYDEFWYRDFRKQKLLVDVKTGETMEWTGLDEDLDLFLKRFPEITVIESEVPTCKLAIVVEGIVMYHGKNPMGIDKYPFVPVLGYFDPQIAYFPYRIQGVVRGIRDPQFLYNRRKLIELDIFESQLNSGYIYKPDSLVNPKDIFLQGQGRGLAVKQDANLSDVQKIDAPGIPQSMLEVSKILGEEIPKISGVNEELLGSAVDDKAGILSMLRQGAGLTTLQILFDQLDYSQKLLGRLYIDLIQSNFSPGKIQRIINEQPSLQFYSKAFGQFDAVVEEGINTATQRQMQFAQLMELRAAGIDIPQDFLIRESSLQNKEDLIEAITKANSQAEQIQSQQIKLAFAEEEAKIKDLEGRAQANAGLALERASRVQENRALAQERLAEAQKDRELGAYELTKAMKELEGMDIDQIERLIGIVRSIQVIEPPQTREEEAAVQTPNIEELAVMAQGEKNGAQGIPG